MSTTVLVVGGSGFIGRHLIEKLLNEGLNVKLLDIHKPNWVSQKVEFLKGSFIELKEEHNVFFKDVNVIYHLASTTTPHSAEKNYSYDIETNLIGTIKLLDLAVKNNVKKFIFSSSGGTVYGDKHSGDISEKMISEPVCSYGVVKLAIEKYLSIYNNKHGMQTCSIRISNPYGIYQDPSKKQGVIPIFINKLINEEVIEIWGDGNIFRDFIYIDDLIEALYKCLMVEYQNEVINIGSSVASSINDVVELIFKSSNKKTKVVYKKSRGYDVNHSCLNIDKAKEVLSWKPTVNLEDGIIKLTNYYIKSEGVK
ncbi:NAD-dependent epimerase/dehydratase family protein [Vibrio sp. TH_r3]|uniref:NAD-dependent epimerase/dehydratase family protein n=1 Tax=Vibrio sp. TH_r3 TaxID=3082084 RepID=UPI0029556198|nr:NAD-dependent epimerase/dehydratase family protein [Vibrio sp. TH_r3]MDV7105996.1 NAD-dependent epimerase/dehydratase family protein [Vibrio sp. TH_r3]